MNNVDQNNQERVGEISEEPGLHWLDVGCAGQGGGHWEVDGGQDHHAGDVHCDNQVILGVSRQVVGGLVDDVHQDGWEVGHHEDAEELLS